MRRGHAPTTLLDLVDRNARANPGVTAIVDGELRVTWHAYRTRARAIALALLDLGVTRGEVVGLHMINRAEHVLADVGALMAGATPASYYNTLSAEQLTHVAHDSAATVVIIDARQLPLWLAIRERLPRLRHIVALDLDPDEPTPTGILLFEQWADHAENELATRGMQVDAARARHGLEDPLSIVYTSGTTGQPKGTLVSQSSVWFMLDATTRQLEERNGGPIPVGWTALSYLPLAHMGERVFSHYAALRNVVTVVYVRDIHRLPTALKDTRPYIFFGVPRIWEKLYSAVRDNAAGGGPLRRMIGRTAISVAMAAGRATYEGRSKPLLHPAMERFVYQRVRTALGLDRVVFAWTGAAALPVELMVFFRGIGLAIIEVYGMTEAAFVTVVPQDAPRLGTVGTVLPGVELMLADDDEILVRGPNLTPGYLNRPDATAEAIDANGWLHTGDLGRLDRDYYLTIIGRKKEMIITAFGKTIAPGTIEATLAEGSELIGSVFVYGDGKPCLVALVTLSANWRSWCDARGIRASSASAAVTDGRVRMEVARALGAGNAKLSRAEQPKNWTLIPDVWGVETGELTPTLKLKRPVITQRYHHDLDALYDQQKAGSWS
ncbi:AMP-dependent synthetase/ligase [Pseudonocardia spinosispora]|uniref:AMP-dependent synthetase/ligase n=1 Tax=Pseudonocardia spinosispora TaxID=103441 RepID=UPI00041D570D|nr:long-chain fatty acid--CoA ligase [Pseudonocardia spinosispora]